MLDAIFGRSSNGHLIYNGIDLAKLAEEYSTPVYVLLTDKVRENYKQFHSAFQQEYRNLVVAYSVKTNYILEVLRVLRNEGSHAEVVSGLETYACKKAGFLPEQIIFNGPHKTDDELREAAHEQFKLVNVDSLSELERADAISRQARVKTSVGIRVAPGSRHEISRFGVSLDEASRSFRRASKMSGVRLEAIHCHLGTQITNLGLYARAIRQLVQLLNEVRETTGIELTYLDIGGGFASPRLRPLKSSRDYRVPTISEYARRICGTIIRELARFDLDQPTLIVEPGRAIVQDTMILITKVSGTKVSFGKRWVILDAGTNLVPSANFFKHEIVPVDGYSDKDLETVNIVGPLCMEADILGIGRRLPKITDGQSIAIMDVGAYALTLSTQFIRPRPRVVAISGDRVSTVRESENPSDLFAKDVGALC